VLGETGKEVGNNAVKELARSPIDETNRERRYVLSELAVVRVAIGECRTQLEGLYLSRRDLLVQAYQAGLNMSEVARTVGVTREAMYRVLRRSGTQFRN
jgi:transcriptional regulator of acetoin/glycerol metabolism